MSLQDILHIEYQSYDDESYQMYIICDRRVRIRDDGSGRPRKTDGKYSEFAHEDAIILLGDPGIGKSTLFAQFGGHDCLSVRHFMLEPKLPTGNAIYLDGLDEYRRRYGSSEAPDDLIKMLIDLGRPNFRLACRAGDWFGDLDHDGFKLASPSRRVVVLELLPLADEEIISIAKSKLTDAEKFLEEGKSYGLGKLLGNPQTLDLFVRAWNSGQRPCSKFEAYKYGIDDLIRESNPAHSSRGATAVSDFELKKAGAAICSNILLGHAVGISSDGESKNEGFFSASSVSCNNMPAIDTILERRIFTSSTTNCFEPIHRTIAEFLGGEDLARRVKSGLPISRVFALMCGKDRAPIASLRGIYAWFMCHLLEVAVPYIHIDPYAVAAYADTSALPPSAQLALWDALAAIKDPWFLVDEDDRGAFSGLANRHTAQRLKQIITDKEASTHLKVAVLEAMLTAPEDIGLSVELQQIVLQANSNGWLRTSALRALAHAKNGDLNFLSELDAKLASNEEDPIAAQLRIALLDHLPQKFSDPDHLLSIIDQVSSFKAGEDTTGYMFLLKDRPGDENLDLLLDHAPKFLPRKCPQKYQIRHLFYDWFVRRLELSNSIDPNRLAVWLKGIQIQRRHDDKVTGALAKRFHDEPDLFDNVYTALCQNKIFEDEREQWIFIVHDIWRFLPDEVWPVPRAAFLLERAATEPNPEYASNYFRVYLNHLPSNFNDIQLSESAWELLDARPDLSLALGDWAVHKIEDWRIEKVRSQRERVEKGSQTRKEHVKTLTPYLYDIQKGKHSSVPWAACVYLGLYNDAKGETPEDRLLQMMNEPLAQAYVSGFVQFLETDKLPSVDKIINSWAENRASKRHYLLTLSIYYRMQLSKPIPEQAYFPCLAAAITSFHRGDELPGYDEVIERWVAEQAIKHPKYVSDTLVPLWLASIDKQRSDFPGLYDLQKDKNCNLPLVDAACEVLTARPIEDYEVLKQLVNLLVKIAPNKIQPLAADALSNTNTPQVVGLWTAAVFIADTGGKESSLSALSTSSTDTLWAAIDVIRGNRWDDDFPIELSSKKQFETISVMGARFHCVQHPIGSTIGDHNKWDASAFITAQIQAIAADNSTFAEEYLEALEENPDLSSYHDHIRHQRTLRAKKVRESQFEYAAPTAVASTLSNNAPATSSDLQAYIIDHLRMIGLEIRGASFERYRAYWNHEDRRLISPKREEICSGLLADDLQRRISPHGLIATVEHHMIADKECDITILQSTEHLLPIEVKHHYNRDLWSAWGTQLKSLYTRDPKTGGYGVYCVLWSGTSDRKIPKPPKGIQRPTSALELEKALTDNIPIQDQSLINVVVIDISPIE